jgi:hypothetical protein
MKPPPTTLEDILLLVGAFAAAVTVLHLVRLAFGFEDEVVRASARAKQLIPALVIDEAAACRAVRSFHLTLPALLAAYAPPLTLAIGYSGCSLLRDAGYLIFPWLIPSALAFSSLITWLADDWRRRVVVEALIELRSDRRQPRATRSFRLPG